MELFGYVGVSVSFLLLLPNTGASVDGTIKRMRRCTAALVLSVDVL